MKRLWRVPCEIEFDLLVIAETEEEADLVARDNVKEDMSMNPVDITRFTPRPIESHRDVPPEWKHSFVYAAGDDNGKFTPTTFLDQPAE